MAKDKTYKDMTLAERIKSIQSQLKVINEQAGVKEGEEPVAFFADSPEAKEVNEVKFIPTACTELNECISGKPGTGGYPIGSMTMVIGQADSGKTARILEDIGKAMQADPNFTALWIESEKSVNNDTLDMLHIDRQRFVMLTMGPQDGGEVVLDRAEALLNTGAFNMFVINSIKALTPKSIINKPISEDTMAVHARMNSKFCAKFIPLFAAKKIAAVVVQHLSTVIGSYGDPFAMTGGQQLKYLSILQLDFRKQSVGDGDPIKREEGMKISVTVKKNHVNTSSFPYGKVTYYVIYGQGTETKLALLQKGLDNGVLTRAGAYIRFVDKETGEVLSWQGKQAFRNALSDPELYKKIEDACGGLNEELTQEEIAELEKEETEEAPAKKTRKKKEDPSDAA